MGERLSNEDRETLAELAETYGRAALLAALGYEQVGWVDEQYDGLLYEMGLADTRGCLPVWAARVSEETP